MNTTQSIDNIIREFLSERDAIAASRRQYAIVLNRFYTFARGRGVMPHQVTTAEVISFKDKVRRVNAYTCNNYLTVLKMFFMWCVRKGYMHHNIAAEVRRERIGTNHDRDSFTLEQLGEMLTHIDTTTHKGARDYAIMLMLVTTGMRGGELTSTTIADLEPYGDRFQLRIIGKGHVRKDRIVMINRDVVKSIAQYFEHRTNLEPDAPLFATVKPGPEAAITTKCIRDIVKQLKANAGINTKHLTPHSIRHTFAVESVKTVGLNETQMLLGHSSSSTTERYVRASTKEIIRNSRMGETILSKLKRNAAQQP